MRVIVTGGCGFIGYNLCQQLDKDGYNVLVIDDLSAGKEQNKISRFTYLYKSIQLPGFMIATINRYQPDIIFHLAAIPGVSFSVENPMSSFIANLVGTCTILEAIRQCDTKGHIRLVNSSSSSIYGGADELPTPNNYPANPKSPYALQKWQIERWCQIYAKLYGIDVVSLRYFNVFGPHNYYGGAYASVLSAWLYHLYIDSDVQPFLEGDGKQTRDFCYVDNIVQANIKAATRKNRFHGESFNIAQGQSHSLLDCKELLEKISGKSLKLEHRPTRVGDIRHSLADIEESIQALGYKPNTDFEKQVENMAKWYQTGYING